MSASEIVKYWSAVSASSSQSSNGSDGEIPVARQRTSQTCVQYTVEELTSSKILHDKHRDELKTTEVETSCSTSSPKHVRSSFIIHFSYLMALVVYTLIGALIFQRLDGDYDDKAFSDYRNRCIWQRDSLLQELYRNCSGESFDACWVKTEQAILAADNCLRNYTEEIVPTDGLSHYLDSVIFCITICTTIGYGHLIPRTLGCRWFFIVYAIIGIPLFLAFVENSSKLCRMWFRKFWTQRDPFCSSVCQKQLTKAEKPQANLQEPTGIIVADECPSKRMEQRPWDERRRTVLATFVLTLCYLCVISGVLVALKDDWSYFEAFYFVFQSVAAIGFGDVHPSASWQGIVQILLVLPGIVLVATCYFFIRVEIQRATFRALSKMQKRAPHELSS